MMIRTIFLSLTVVLVPALSLAAPEPTQDKNLLGADFSSLPTYIKSDRLTLRSNDRIFVYTGNVEVKQGDMTLTSKELEGTYDEQNQIQQLTAKQNVVIVKGEGIRATGERAVYTAASDTLVLTENPELTQEGSVLTADAITIFLEEDRSVAEGEVRVKVVNQEKEPKAAGEKKKKG